MAEQRQPFRFRLPWLAAPQPTPAAPRPSQETEPPSQRAPAAPRTSQATQAPPQTEGPRVQRPPFRPAGSAPVQTPPPAAIVRAEPQSSSLQGKSKPTSQLPEARPSRGSPGSPSHTISQVQDTSRPTSPSQVSSKLQEAAKVPPQSPFSTFGSTQQSRPIATSAPPLTPPQAKIPSRPNNTSAKTSESPQYPKELRKPDTSMPPTEEPKRVPATARSTEKRVEFLAGAKKQPDFEEPKIMDHRDKPREEAVIDKGIIAPKAQTKAHPLAELDEQGQSSEDVFGTKEVFQKFGNDGSDAQSEIRGSQERSSRFPHKHAMAAQKTPFHKEVKENSPKFMHKQSVQQDKNISHGKPLCIVTLTGENNGAIMQLSSESPKIDRPVHIHRGYKIEPDKVSETTTDEEGSSREKKSGNTYPQEELATMSYINNNVQGINNSLVFNSTVAERNPGVHVVTSRNPVKPIKPGKVKEMFNTHKVEVSSTPAEKLAYAPTIRRRCLRGLFMETSDSDPEKPRRHGCRAKCTQSKDENINVL
ncbi:unnamed protein product [Amaranthus hypochondriacus]